MLGRGGMGVVYEAVLHGPAGFRKPVALKVLHQGQGAHLVREARLGGLLRHENLVDVYELGEADGTWFQAMELVPGSLRERLPLSPRAVVDVGLQVCAGLQHAHEEIGLVHLDLKPDNLLLAGATVKVADLGVAQARGFGGGRIVGTPGYMSPEQRLGSAVDARADVYGLGVVLVELATGVPPTAGRETWSGDLPEPPLVEHRAPQWLRPVVDRCLEPDPARRFPSMAALAEALRALPVEGPGLADDREERPAAPRRTTNLEPDEIDAFIGRDDAVLSLVEQLVEPGLWTLKGPGGVGKTRLARAVCRRVHHDRGLPAWFCDLTDAGTEVEVVVAVARMLGVNPGREDLAGAVAHALRGADDVVVVLDNFEQLLVCAPLVGTWRAHAPRARFLVTSQAPLRLAGEQVVEVAPLGVEASVALLVQRARERGREVGRDPALEELAARLDGLPLALELAAARLGVLRPADVSKRLDARLELLGGSRRDGLARHATLRATLEWSWELLDDDQRAALSQLSVFVGAFGVEAAEDVILVPSGAPALDVLDALADRSLLAASDGGLSLLESVAAFAASRLADPDGAALRHARHFARLGDPAALARLEGADAPDAWRTLFGAGPNLIAACRAAVRAGDEALLLPLFRAVAELFTTHGPATVGVELSGAAAALPLSGPTHAELLCHHARCLRFAGKRDAALETFTRALGLARAHPAPRAEIRSLLGLGVLAAELGDPAAATHATEALAVASRIGDPLLEAVAHQQLAFALGPHRGRPHLERASELAARHGLFRVALFVAGTEVEWAITLGQPWRTVLGRLERGVQALGDRRLEALTAGIEARGCSVVGDWMGAIAAYRKAIAAARVVGGRTTEFLSLIAMSVVQSEIHQIDEARRSLREAQIASAGAEHAAVLIGVELANLDRLEGHPDAESRLREALAAAVEVRDRRAGVRARLALGRWLACAERLEEARDLLVETLALPNAGTERSVLGRVALELAGLSLLLGRPEEALAALGDDDRCEVDAAMRVARQVRRLRCRVGRAPASELSAALDALRLELVADEVPAHEELACANAELALAAGDAEGCERWLAGVGDSEPTLQAVTARVLRRRLEATRSC